MSRSLDAGQEFHVTREHDGGLFLLEEGHVIVCKLTSSGKQLTITVHSAGTVLPALRLQGLYVRALEPSVLAFMSREDLAYFLRRKPEIGSRLIDLLAKHLRLMDAWISDVIHKTVPARLANLIVWLIGEEGIVVTWSHAANTLVDRYLLRYQQPVGQRYRAELDNAAGWDAETIHFKHGLDILIRCVNRKLEKVRPLLEQKWWDPPPAGSTSIRLVRWWHCPDLLAAMYLQFYFLITDRTPIRVCANPNCRMPFPAPRKDKRFCSSGCRSTGRKHPH